MLFSSTIFLYGFLPIVLLLYFVAPGTRARNAVLLLASLIFYAWGEAGYVLLLLASIALNYGFGLVIARAGDARGRTALAVGVTANLLLLGVFKYANFAADTLAPILAPIGIGPLALAPIHLPIGISFFTFQAITYLVDVRRGDAPVQRSPFRVALYIALFPQLIAGPIVRYRAIAAELAARVTRRDDVAAGARRFVVGLGKKVLIADTLAVPVDRIFELPGAALTPELAWLGAGLFALQIYYDFSGYSDMAIGIGRVLGFHFPENFAHPYVSRSLREFWRRWHITLSTWFRDYLYIPLGGSRKGAARTHANLVLVFLLCGLWHGASFTFVVWGAIHGAFLVAERHGVADALARLGPPVQHVVTLAVVLVAWVFFRAASLDAAMIHLAAMFGLGGTGSIETVASIVPPQAVLAAALGVVGAMPWLPWAQQRLEAVLGERPDATWRAANAALSGIVVVGLHGVLFLCAMRLAAGTHEAFIYFRF